MTCVCQPPHDDYLLDINAASQRLGIKVRMTRRLVADKRIRYVKVGSLLRFRACDLDHFIEAATVEPSAGRPQPPRGTAKGALSSLTAS